MKLLRFMFTFWASYAGSLVETHNTENPNHPTGSSASKYCQDVVTSESSLIINCSYAEIDRLAEDVIDEGVTALDLSHNRIEEMFSVFHAGKLYGQLVTLNISHNSLAAIHDIQKDMGMIRLKELDLSYNLFRFYPPFLKTVEILKMENNFMEELVMRELHSCKRLRKLSLKGNAIRSINSNCDARVETNIHHIDLSMNAIEKIENCAFNQLENLLYLNLSDNRIDEIRKGAFNDLNRLEKLDLSKNRIEVLPDDMFAHMNDLKILDLSANRLKTLPNVLPMMDLFDTSYNRISSISEQYSTILFPQSLFLIGGNPFICTCELLWLKELYDTRKYLLKYRKTLDTSKFIPVCELPENLKGKTWNNLEDNAFECSGLDEADLKLTNQALYNIKHLNVKVKLSASEIGHNYMNLKWSTVSDTDVKSVEIKYHPFGKREKMKTLVMPVSVNSYRLRKLDSNTPYIICLHIDTNVNLEDDCVEVITASVQYNDVMGAILSMDIFVFVYSNFSILTFIVGLLTVIYVMFILLKHE